MSKEEALAQEIAKVVKELNNAILALRTLIEREYPNRREIEAQFVKKESSDRRLVLLVITVLVAALLSFGFTASTMSACFLGDGRPQTCNLLPGYEESNKERDDFVRKLTNNDKDLDERVKRLERRQP